MKEKILITGATGNTGAEVIKILKRKNQPVVAALRNPDVDKKMLEADIPFVWFDFEKPESYQLAFQDVKKIYLIRPPAISNVKKHIFPVIDAAKAAGVEHIVLLSLMGAENNSFVPHRKIEKYLIQINMPYTFIRPSFFMQNLSTTHKQDIKEFNEIFVPAGKGKTSFIDVRDISEVSAIALTEQGHEFKAYELSGKEAIDYFQAAAIFSKVLGRKIRYTNPSMLSFYLKWKKKGIPSGFILIMIALYTVCKLGLAKGVTNEIQRLLGREPISFEQFVKDNKEVWS